MPDDPPVPIDICKLEDYLAQATEAYTQFGDTSMDIKELREHSQQAYHALSALRSSISTFRAIISNMYDTHPHREEYESYTKEQGTYDEDSDIPF